MPTQPEARSDSRGPVGATDLTGSSDFDRDLIAAKRGSASDAERVAALDAVLTKYGFPRLAASRAAAPRPEPVAEAPAKAAASAFSPIMRDFTADNDIHTFYTSINVGALKTVTVTAIGTAPVDPFLVAFVRNGGQPLAYPVTVAAWNDDVTSTNRNSQITFKNPNLAAQKVEIVAFNFLPSTRGTVIVNIINDGVSTAFPSRFLGGSVVYGSNAIPSVPSNCFPGVTRLTETRLSGTRRYNAAALVIDTQTKKGGIIWDDPDLGSQTLSFSPMINNPYPSFGLLFEAVTAQSATLSEEVSSYRYKQVDSYSCVN